MKKKLLALFLCCVMVFSLVPMAFTTAYAAGNGLQIYGSNGAVAETVLLKMTDKTALTAVAATGSGSYQWQIHVSGDVWANIVGTNGNTLELSYALVANLLNGDTAEIRCKLTDDAGTDSYSNTVTVQIQQSTAARKAPAAAPAVGTVISGAQPLGDPVITPAEAPSNSAPAANDAPAAESAPAANDTPAADAEPAANDAPAADSEAVVNDAPAAESGDAAPADAGDPAPQDDPAPADDAPVNDAPVNDAPVNDVPADETPADDTPSTYTILINYVFADGKQAAPSWSATVATGSTYTQDIQSPVVVGYTPSETVVHVNTSEAKTYTVTYQAAEVDFTVKHYQQNVSNDEYTLADTETKNGFTESAVGAGLAKTDYTGFYSLLYDTTTTIAADGSTVVKVYYDRYYYLMNFDLDGGYGVEPIYARYGAAISVDTPTKPGYSFGGWSLDGSTVSALPATMPAENRTYKAVWTADDTAKVTVVFWGENADDEGYSYIKSAQVNVKPGTEFTYSENGTLICALEVHTHDARCYTLTCTQEEHTHSESCNTCGKTEHTTHTTACYAGVGNRQNVYTGVPNNPVNGQVVDHWYYGKLIYIGGSWYRYSGSTSDGGIAPTICHKHSDSCLGCGKTEHTHSIENGCYTLTCGKTEHSHTSDCYMSGAGLDSNLWKFVKSDTVTVAADGSSVVNVYYDRTEKTLTFKYNYRSGNYRSTETITAKWGSNIAEQYKKIAANAGSTFWSAQTSGDDPYTNYFGVMPQTSATYYNRGATGDEGTMTYWGQDLNGDYTVKLFEVTGVGGYTVTGEDRYEFEGFTYHHGTSNGSSCSGAAFYYTRNSYTLTFNDGYNDVKTESVKFEAPLSSYSSYVPNVPSAYESGSVTFGGWYLNPECTGAEYKLNDHTMPADNVLLYAKWVPVTHKVEFYLDNAALENGTKLSTHPDITVLHGSKADPAPETPENGSYTFIGRFYMEDGVEKAFDFANMPVTKDLQVYGKWSSNKLMKFEVRYELEDGTEIAPPFTGSALAGSTKTFNAKTGTQLNKDYQSGYFPKVSSHSITIDIADASKNKYTFVYVAKTEVQYTVRYLDKTTGKPVVVDGVPTPDKVVKTRDAVVTETFKQITGYAPDAYQKQLVLAAENNEIIFWYVKDDAHAPVRVIHWQQNLEGDGYTERQSSTNLNGVIGTEYSETPLTIAGFTYNETKSNASGELTAAGLVLNLYYDRIEYPYEFRFLEQGTNTVLADAVTGKARYQAQVTQTAKTIPGYTLVSAENQAIHIAIEDGTTAVKNVKIFYYTEQTVDIKYVVVGPDGCGTLDNYQDVQLKVTTGEVKGSAPTAADGFKFVGWYKDKDCTQPVDAAWVADSKLTPGKTKNYGTAEKPVMGYEAATYYAKFEYDVADLTITKTGCVDTDLNQSFIFTITGPDGYRNQIVIKGNGSVTIKGLKIGEYTIHEESGWSWRYSCADQKVTLKGGADVTNSVTMANSRDNDKWLDNNASADNIFTGAN